MKKIVSRDTADKRGQLLKIVAEQIAADPYAYNGFKWAAQPQEWWCAKAGFSESTLRRLIGKPPFVKACIQIDGRKVTLIREGVEGPKPPKHVANIMAKVWKAEMEKRGMTETSVTRKQWGCLFGLAELWPEGDQIEIFKTAVSQWPHFMEGVKIDMAILETMGVGYTRFYQHPSISVIRAFHPRALELYKMTKQAKGSL